MSDRGAICFYSEYLFPVLAGTREMEFAGGAETQQAKIARGLTARGFDVRVVTCDFGQPARIVIDGITVLRSFQPRRGLPVLRFFHPRLTRAVGALRAADAEVYYVNGSGLAAGLTYDVARSKHAAFVLHTASDYEVIQSLPMERLARDRWWYRRALHGADVRLAQTEAQQRSLRLEFGLGSEVLPNLVELPASPTDPGQDGAVVWLGTYKAIKRPHWFTDLAREFPRHRFVMVGVVPPPPLTRLHWTRARAAAELLPNLSVMGFMDHARIVELFTQASLLVHTSPAEGFSNVMLEAWSHGLPTVSAVNPDGLVTREGLGAVVADFPELVREVGRLLGDAGARIEAGRRARAYVASHHAPETVYDRLAATLDRVVAGVRARRERSRTEPRT